MIHIGNRRSLKTKCGRPVARRWWVEDSTLNFGRQASLATYWRANPSDVADCWLCIKAFRPKAVRR